jgi:hypothetical protein
VAATGVTRSRSACPPAECLESADADSGDRQDRRMTCPIELGRVVPELLTKHRLARGR